MNYEQLLSVLIELEKKSYNEKQDTIVLQSVARELLKCNIKRPLPDSNLIHSGLEEKNRFLNPHTQSLNTVLQRIVQSAEHYVQTQIPHHFLIHQTYEQLSSGLKDLKTTLASGITNRDKDYNLRINQIKDNVSAICNKLGKDFESLKQQVNQVTLKFLEQIPTNETQPELDLKSKQLLKTLDLVILKLLLKKQEHIKKQLDCLNSIRIAEEDLNDLTAISLGIYSTQYEQNFCEPTKSATFFYFYKSESNPQLENDSFSRYFDENETTINSISEALRINMRSFFYGGILSEEEIRCLINKEYNFKIITPENAMRLTSKKIDISSYTNLYPSKTDTKIPTDCDEYNAYLFISDVLTSIANQGLKLCENDESILDLNAKLITIKDFDKKLELIINIIKQLNCYPSLISKNANLDTAITESLIAFIQNIKPNTQKLPIHYLFQDKFGYNSIVWDTEEEFKNRKIEFFPLNSIDSMFNNEQEFISGPRRRRSSLFSVPSLYELNTPTFRRNNNSLFRQSPDGPLDTSLCVILLMDRLK